MPKKFNPCSAGFQPIDVLTIHHVNSRGEISPTLGYFKTQLGNPVVGVPIAAAVAKYHQLEESACLLLRGTRHRAIWSDSHDLNKIEALAHELSADFAGGFYAMRDLRKAPPQFNVNVEVEGSL